MGAQRENISRVKERRTKSKHKHNYSASIQYIDDSDFSQAHNTHFQFRLVIIVIIFIVVQLCTIKEYQLLFVRDNFSIFFEKWHFSSSSMALFSTPLVFGCKHVFRALFTRLALSLFSPRNVDFYSVFSLHFRFRESIVWNHQEQFRCAAKRSESSENVSCVWTRERKREIGKKVFFHHINHNFLISTVALLLLLLVFPLFIWLDIVNALYFFCSHDALYACTHHIRINFYVCSIFLFQNPMLLFSFAFCSSPIHRKSISFSVLYFMYSLWICACECLHRIRYVMRSTASSNMFYWELKDFMCVCLFL